MCTGRCHRENSHPLLEARDYSGYIRANQRLTYEVKSKMNGICKTLFLNSDSAELTIKSFINKSPASDVYIEAGDFLIKINGNSTRGMGL